MDRSERVGGVAPFSTCLGSLEPSGATGCVMVDHLSLFLTSLSLSCFSKNGDNDRTYSKGCYEDDVTLNKAFSRVLGSLSGLSGC